MKSLIYGVVSVLMITSWTVRAAPDYKVTLIDGMREAIAINNSGDVTGNGDFDFGIYSGIGANAFHFSLDGGLRNLGVQIYESLDNASNYYFVGDINDQGNALVSYTGYYNGAGDIEGYGFQYYFLQNVRTGEFVPNVGGAAINNLNNVVGGRFINGPEIGLVGLRDNVTVPQEDTIAAYTINDSNTVAGYVKFDSEGRPTSSVPFFIAPAVWYTPVAPTYLDRGGFQDGAVNAINNAGLIVGYVGDTVFFEPDGRAALWDDGVLKLLTNGDFDGAIANGINNSGAIVGTAQLFSTDDVAAVLWLDGELIDLNRYLSVEQINAGWSLEWASDINDSGWIVGRAVSSKTGEERAFLLSISAVPEPTAWMFLIAGLGLITIVRRIRGD